MTNSIHSYDLISVSRTFCSDYLVHLEYPFSFLDLKKMDRTCKLLLHELHYFLPAYKMKDKLISVWYKSVLNMSVLYCRSIGFLIIPLSIASANWSWMLYMLFIRPMCMSPDLYTLTITNFSISLWLLQSFIKIVFLPLGKVKREKARIKLTIQDMRPRESNSTCRRNNSTMFVKTHVNDEKLSLFQICSHYFINN